MVTSHVIVAMRPIILKEKYGSREQSFFLLWCTMSCMAWRRERNRITSKCEKVLAKITQVSFFKLFVKEGNKLCYEGEQPSIEYLWPPFKEPFFTQYQDPEILYRAQWGNVFFNFSVYARWYSSLPVSTFIFVFFKENWQGEQLSYSSRVISEAAVTKAKHVFDGNVRRQLYSRAQTWIYFNYSCLFWQSFTHQLGHVGIPIFTKTKQFSKCSAREVESLHGAPSRSSPTGVRPLLDEDTGNRWKYSLRYSLISQGIR